MAGFYPIFLFENITPADALGSARTDRLRMLIAHGDLGNELLENGIRKGLIVLGSDHECAGTADDVVGIVSIEHRLDREDRQAIDADAGADGIVTGEGDQSAAIVGTVTGNVDDAACSAIGALRK